MSSNTTTGVFGVDASRITVAVDGESLGTFDTISDSTSTAEYTRSRGGDTPAVEDITAHKTSHGEVTLTRRFMRSRDAGVLKRLRQNLGAPATATEQPLDTKGAPFDDPTTFHGTLTSASVNGSDVAGTGNRMLTIVIAVGSVS